MESFFVESKSGKIYVSFHEPHSNFMRKTGVIICSPIGQEQIRTYRLLFTVAERLVQENFPTIRFDFYGCGDSEGSLNNANISIWLSNINDLVKELLVVYSLKKIILIGVRFGGCLTNLYLEQMDSSASHEQILWCPVINGKMYLKELKIQHRKWVSGSFVNEKLYSKDEFLGFSFPKRLIEEISNIDFSKRESMTRGLLLESNNSFSASIFPKMNHVKVIEDEFWIKGDDEASKALIPYKDIEYLVNWLKTNHE